MVVAGHLFTYHSLKYILICCVCLNKKFFNTEKLWKGYQHFQSVNWSYIGCALVAPIYIYNK